ncbi:MAG TPA: hypothetical protein VHC22_06675 [Pirellulales bacterium]|nr:hypothetical protein [Pirellulales bacterium]
MIGLRDKPTGYVACVAVAAIVAVVGARNYAGGWNDGSRLATVECLVDNHTLAIDQSVFVDVPHERVGTVEPFPYSRDDPGAWVFGTLDKIRVDGHWYSHKPPVPAVALAGAYAAWQKLAGGTARDRCNEFCYCMTLVSAGAAYVIAIASLFHLAGILGLTPMERLLVSGSFALTTMAPVYARHVNDHILLLAVAMLAAANLLKLAEAIETRGPSWRRDRMRLLLVGALGGLGYAIDQASGPLLLTALFAVIAYRTRGQFAGLVLFASAALPCIVLHQALNYAVGGTIRPIGSVVEYFAWPGSPFSRETMTGFWNHPSLRHFVAYLSSMLFDLRRGFVLHNLSLLLLLPGVVTLWRRHAAQRPELLALGGWAAGTWLAYGALSNNLSGVCCSIRWFVPLLAFGYVALAVLVRHDERYRRGLWLLSAVGLPLAAMMWWNGPWREPETAFFVRLERAGVAVWLGWCVWAFLPAVRSAVRAFRPLTSPG